MMSNKRKYMAKSKPNNTDTKESQKKKKKKIANLRRKR